MIDKKLTLLILAFSITAQPAIGQRQLLCEPGEACSVTCYQAGLDEATTVFSRDQLDTLQVDLNARVLKMEFRDELEDIHMHIEQALIDRLGDLGRKLHTARSRNDQVATDFRLWCRDEIDQLD